MRKMKAEREKIHAKVKADTVRLNGSKLELTADEETCTFLLVSEGSCTLQMGENDLLLNPGSALLLGAVFRAGQADAVGNHGRGEKGACEEAGKRA